MLSVDQEVVVLLKIFTGVVVVERLLRVVVRDDEISRELRHRWRHARRGPVPHGGYVGDAPPTVEGAVVCGLSATVEHDIPRNHVPSAELIVEVDERPWAVEKDVVLYDGLAGHRLEHGRRL